MISPEPSSCLSVQLSFSLLDVWNGFVPNFRLFQWFLVASWLGFYLKLQHSTIVSQTSLNNRIAEMTLTICLLPTFTKLFVPAEHTRRKLIQYKYIYDIAVPSKLWNKRCLPFGRSTCVLSALPTSP